MTDAEFDLVKQNLSIQGKVVPPNAIEIIETHISYLLLWQEHVYKIKKSVKLPFLDFSRLESRKNACTQELLLNQRLSPGIYLGLVTVSKEKDSLAIDGPGTGKPLDYAVWMKRVDKQLEMDELLDKKKVSEKQTEQLAEIIGDFHKKAFEVHKPWSLDYLQDSYNQISAWQAFVAQHLGEDNAQLIRHSCQLSDRFLSRHIDLINQRSKRGWVRDLHGDLHSRNIFLTDPPLIFDCIEFDDDLRQIDVLNEIAFFLMDLEYYHAYPLAEHFSRHYTSQLKGSPLEGSWDEALLVYFKMYRASVRAKVLLISAKESEDKARQAYLEQVVRYLELVGEYADALA